jgi:glutaredoxin
MEYDENQDIIIDLKWKNEQFQKDPPQQSQIFYFALTTCAYCKKGMNWLKEKQINYKWLNLDEYPIEEKQAIKNWVKKKFKLSSDMGLPFVIFRSKSGEYHSNGYDPEYWKAKIR